LGLNEVDTLQSNAILIYSHKEKSIYTWYDRQCAI